MEPGDGRGRGPTRPSQSKPPRDRSFLRKGFCFRLRNYVGLNKENRSKVKQEEHTKRRPIVSSFATLRSRDTPGLRPDSTGWDPNGPRVRDPTPPHPTTGRHRTLPQLTHLYRTLPVRPTLLVVLVSTPPTLPPRLGATGPNGGVADMSYLDASRVFRFPFLFETKRDCTGEPSPSGLPHQFRPRGLDHLFPGNHGWDGKGEAFGAFRVFMDAESAFFKGGAPGLDLSVSVAALEKDVLGGRGLQDVRRPLTLGRRVGGLLLPFRRGRVSGSLDLSRDTQYSRSTKLQVSPGHHETPRSAQTRVPGCDRVPRRTAGRDRLENRSTPPTWVTGGGFTGRDTLRDSTDFCVSPPRPQPQPNPPDVPKGGTVATGVDTQTATSSTAGPAPRGRDLWTRGEFTPLALAVVAVEVVAVEGAPGPSTPEEGSGVTLQDLVAKMRRI